MGRRHVLVRQVAREGVPVELARDVGVDEQRLQLRGEQQPVREPRIVERLLAEAIARGEQPPRRRVPEDEGEHPVEPLEARRTVVLVRVQDDLRVGARGEDVTPPP